MAMADQHNPSPAKDAAGANRNTGVQAAPATIVDPVALDTASPASTTAAAEPAAKSAAAPPAAADTLNVYDEVEIEDMDLDIDEEFYTYPCPCGDNFVIYVEDLQNGEDIAKCPSCSLLLKVVYDPAQFGGDGGESFEVDTSIQVA